MEIILVALVVYVAVLAFTFGLELGSGKEVKVK
jgi:hypothetical protein